VDDEDRESAIAELASWVREHLAWEETSGSKLVAPWSGERSGGAEGAAEWREPAASEPAVIETVEPAGSWAPPASVPSAPRAAPAPSSASPAVPAPAASRMTPGDRRARLDVLAAAAASCVACRLHEGRTRSVWARGNAEAIVAFVGEGPGYNEDQQGLPFVGPAGQLLDKMILAMGLTESEHYVCNVVKCRPPENRTPLPDEAAACSTYLTEQLDLVGPRVIVALGRCAAENLGCAEPGRSWRGTWGSYRGVPVMPTYHPAYLLRSPEMKRPVWEDLQRVLEKLGRRAPPRSG
jgi:uracil-DNA glycosylase family 4